MALKKREFTRESGSVDTYATCDVRDLIFRQFSIDNVAKMSPPADEGCVTHCFHIHLPLATPLTHINTVDARTVQWV